MTFRIESPDSAEALTAFLSFQDRVNERASAWWPAMVDMNLPMLRGEGPSAARRRFLPLVAVRDGEIVARVLGVMDERYHEHWGEPLGHLCMFEALPDTTEEVRALAGEACAWMRDAGMEAVRAGFGIGDFPFLIDAHDVLPPILLRQNPSYYHALLKEARFESERGWVDYKAPVTDEHLARWREMAVDPDGFEVRTMRDVPPERRVADFVPVWNDGFSRHWGVVPQLDEEFAGLLGVLEPLGALDTMMVAYRDEEPVGCLNCSPEAASFLAKTNGRALSDAEKVNFLGIAVREGARGTGVNLAMAARSFLELARRGARYVSYTLVLDDNWPSRRTAEKLGASICANYLVYRRDLTRG